MARFTFRLPDIGEGIAEAEIVALHVRVGERVEEDQQIADMMTDKATVEMESPVSGTVVEIGGDVGDIIAIGSTLMVIETEAAEGAADTEKAGGAADGAVHGAASLAAGSDPDAADVAPDAAVVAAENPGVAEVTAHQPVVAATIEVEPAPTAPVSPPAPTAPVSPPAPAVAAPPPTHAAKVLASPAVRDRAKALEIDLAQVKPSEDDRVRHADLDAFLRYSSGGGYNAPAATPADEAVRVIGMRRRIAENMAASKRHIPHFTYVEEVEVTALEAMRADLNAARGSRPKLTVLPLLIVGICQVLRDYPMLNARYDDEAGVVNRSGAVHLGMATQTDAGLMVPVIRDAQAKNVWQLASEIARLADAARSGKAASAELSGSTITITSLGPLGGVATTPVINRPEVAIIGPNRIVERPVFVDGDSDRVRRAKLMNISISCDHRVVDGWDAASFIGDLKRLLEAPVRLFA